MVEVCAAMQVVVWLQSAYLSVEAIELLDLLREVKRALNVAAVELHVVEVALGEV